MALTREATTAYSTPVGSVKAFGGSSIPTGWLLCDGTAILRTTYANLFAVISTAYGTGNGSTTFNLPDLRGRVPVGKDAGTFSTLGATGGVETHVLLTTQMPVHSHTGTTDLETQEHTHAGTINQETSDHTHAVSISEPGTTEPTDVGLTTLTHAKPVSHSSGGRSSAHTHTITIGGRSAAHSHTFTTNNTGSGAAHPNLQPYQVVNHIIKY